MKKKQCKCRSYNRPEKGQTVESVRMKTPQGYDKKYISVDACVAPVVQILWENDVATLSSCCGHNERRPSLVLEQNLTLEKAKEIRALIRGVDNRDFELLSWVLTELLNK